MHLRASLLHSGAWASQESNVSGTTSTEVLRWLGRYVELDEIHNVLFLYRVFQHQVWIFHDLLGDGAVVCELSVRKHHTFGYLIMDLNAQLTSEF